METQHTPGPWHIHKRYPFWVDDADNLRVVDLEASRYSVDEARANARLIAAAPELLEACEKALARIESDISGTCAESVALRAAIAKARGEGE